jgi:hypothetical protein
MSAVSERPVEKLAIKKTNRMMVVTETALSTTLRLCVSVFGLGFKTGFKSDFLVPFWIASPSAIITKTKTAEHT